MKGTTSFLSVIVPNLSEVCLLGHKVQVSFTDEQWRLIMKAKERMGTTDADIVRNIVIAWLSEKSIISQCLKDEMSRGRQ